MSFKREERERGTVWIRDPSSLIGISVECDTRLNIHRRFHLVYSGDNVCGRRMNRSIRPPDCDLSVRHQQGYEWIQALWSLFLSVFFICLSFSIPSPYTSLNFITSLGKKDIHGFIPRFINSRLSSLSPLSLCSLFAVHDENDYAVCFIPFLLFMHEGRGKKKSFSRNESLYASRIEFIKLINNFFLGYFLSLLQLLFSLCLSLFLPLTRSITHKSFSNVKPC